MRNGIKIGKFPIYLNAASVGLVLALALCLGACRVQVDKDANGKEKNVHVDTPFGGVHVNTDQTAAADLGLPVYPGAEPVNDDEKHKSADVHLGFGEWQMRFKVVTYSTPDSQEKVSAFYKKALTRFGDVITCQGTGSIGTPSVTQEGLTCAENEKNGKFQFNNNDFKQDFQLKAGSKKHQHIVAFEDQKAGRTRFVLVALDLPAGMATDSDKSE